MSVMQIRPIKLSASSKYIGKDIKYFHKSITQTQHQFHNIRFENERLCILIETKNKFINFLF